MAETLLIVDDESDLLSGLVRTLERKLEATLLTATSGETALKILEARPVDLMLADIRMPGMDGLELLSCALKADPDLTVILMTGHGTIETAVQAIRKGAWDFIPKPFDMATVLHAVRKGCEHNRLVRENQRLSRMVCEMAPGMIGKSKGIREVFDRIRMLSRTDVTVLIGGETGTGKEMAARAIHEQSARRGKAMITVNCPAIPESILESELFGYKKGAFTGAETDRTGQFDAAEGGTIFLDEIGDLPMSIQTKLLRVLQEREVQPLGTPESHRVDVRILAATNRNLEEKIADGSFRADLYYRLNVASLVMPPLRENREDIPLLVEHFLEKSACQLGVEPKTIAETALLALTARDWPGNVRELENFIQGLTATTPASHIPEIPASETPRTPPRCTQFPEPDPALPYKVLKERVIDAFTLDYLDRLLTETDGNISKAARISGIQRQSLQKIVRRYELDVAHYRGDAAM